MAQERTESLRKRHYSEKGGHQARDIYNRTRTVFEQTFDLYYRAFPTPASEPIQQAQKRWVWKFRTPIYNRRTGR